MFLISLRGREVAGKRDIDTEVKSFPSKKIGVGSDLIFLNVPFFKDLWSML
jgi:hypothetical protein